MTAGESAKARLRGFLSRFTRKAAILLAFSVPMWGLLYLPVPIIEGFNAHQWLIWFGVTTWYDFPAEVLGAFLILRFDTLARGRKWY